MKKTLKYSGLLLFTAILFILIAGLFIAKIIILREALP